MRGEDGDARGVDAEVAAQRGAEVGELCEKEFLRERAGDFSDGEVCRGEGHAEAVGRGHYHQRARGLLAFFSAEGGLEVFGVAREAEFRALD